MGLCNLLKVNGLMRYFRFCAFPPILCGKGCEYLVGRDHFGGLKARENNDFIGAAKPVESPERNQQYYTQSEHKICPPKTDYFETDLTKNNRLGRRP